SDAAHARDFDGAYRAALDGQMAWARFSGRLSVYGSHAAVDPAGVRDASTIGRSLDGIVDLLEQLRRRDVSGDPTGAEAVGEPTGGGAWCEMCPAQSTLGDKREAAAAKAREAGQRMTVTPRDLEPALDGAIARMRGAASQLATGDAMQAEGSEGAAARHVR